jgi:hypothetical protein
MSTYAPDVRQFHKQRQADAKRHLRHLRRQASRPPRPTPAPRPRKQGGKP